MTLEHELIKICFPSNSTGRRDRPDKSFSNQATRLRITKMIARSLTRKDWYGEKLRAENLGGRHANRLMNHWKNEGLSVGTLKNRKAVIGFVYERLGKGHMIPRDNSVYGIGKRSLRTVSRASELSEVALSFLDARHPEYAERMKVSLRLQRYLGMRYEESTKIRPMFANQRDDKGIIVAVRLQGSWCKSGRERRIEVRSDLQRKILEDAEALVGDGSMIPNHLSYSQWKSRFYYAAKKAGLPRFHDLRHAYAQQRYFELTGHEAPIVQASNSDTENLDWVDDDKARLTISSELGHGRKHISSAYLGKSILHKNKAE